MDKKGFITWLIVLAGLMVGEATLDVVMPGLLIHATPGAVGMVVPDTECAVPGASTTVDGTSKTVPENP